LIIVEAQKKLAEVLVSLAPRNLSTI